MLKEKETQCKYKRRAILVLRLHSVKFPEDSMYSWLCNVYLLGAFAPFDSEDFREEILSELGRIEDDYELRYAAKKVCQLKPQTEEAINMIRRFREVHTVNSVNLVREVVSQAVTDYQKVNPCISDLDVNRAFYEFNSEYWTRNDEDEIFSL
jgi:hypothetical protein